MGWQGADRPVLQDHAISIATIHHFATETRRMEAIKVLFTPLCLHGYFLLQLTLLSPLQQLIKTVTPPRPSSSIPSPTSPSKILISVWALEQDPALYGVGSARRGKKGTVPATGVPGEEEGGATPAEGEEQEEQDVFVPWELQGPKIIKPRMQRPIKKPGGRKGRSEAPPPLSDDATTTRAKELEPTPTPTDVLEAPSNLEPTSTEPSPEPVAPKPTFHRYYHLFRQGELTALVQRAAQDPAVGAEFVSPVKEEPLDGLEHGGGGDGGGEKGRQWRRQVSLVGDEERWERENWVVEINVRWALM